MNVNWFWHKHARYERQLSQLAADVLPETERSLLQNHLTRCPACQQRWQSLQQLARLLEIQGHQLPPVTPPQTLRERWQTAVRHEPRHRFAPVWPKGIDPATGPLAWLVGGRLSWASVGACWLLILFFQATAPQVPRPAMKATSITLHEVVLVLERTRPQPRPDSLNRANEPESPGRPPIPAPRSRRSSAVNFHARLDALSLENGKACVGIDEAATSLGPGRFITRHCLGEYGHSSPRTS